MNPDSTYHGPRGWPVSILANAANRPGIRAVTTWWVALTLFSIATGVVNVAFGWNGLEMTLFGLAVNVTVYPPFLVALLLAVWMGPVWGAVPLYLANLASALVSGMPLPISALFAMAGPVEIAVLWGTMTLLNVRPELSRRRDFGLFIVIGLIAPTASSLAAPLWNAAHQLDLLQGQRVWRGWVVGDFLQIVLIAAPILFLGTRRVQEWLQGLIGSAPHNRMGYGTAVSLVAAVFTMLGTLVFFGVRNLAATLEIAPDATTPAGELLMPRLIEISVFLAVLFVVLLLTTVLFTAALALRSQSEHEVALRDMLTGCLNRRAFAEIFSTEANRSGRLEAPLSLMFLDADHFKSLNDRFGHGVGDRILQQLVRRIQNVIRETDHLFRWGGDEFVLLLPHTDPEQALVLAERIRSDTAARPLLSDEGTEPIAVTLSIGVAGRHHPPFDAESMVQAADVALYSAKELGQNRAELSGALLRPGDHADQPVRDQA